MKLWHNPHKALMLFKEWFPSEPKALPNKELNTSIEANCIKYETDTLLGQRVHG